MLNSLNGPFLLIISLHFVPMSNQKRRRETAPLHGLYTCAFSCGLKFCSVLEASHVMGPETPLSTINNTLITKCHTVTSRILQRKSPDFSLSSPLLHQLNFFLFFFPTFPSFFPFFVYSFFLPYSLRFFNFSFFSFLASLNPPQCVK